jgi:hypothetical protein
VRTEPTPLAERMINAADDADARAADREMWAESARHQATTYEREAAQLRREARELRARADAPVECAP